MSTRTQLRTSALQWADAVGSPRWDLTAGGEVDKLGTFAADTLWRRILNANPRYRMGANITASTDAAGALALSAIPSGTGDTLQRLYRVASVAVDGVPYRKVNMEEFFLGVTINPSTAYRVWYSDGTSLFAAPVQATHAFSAILYNHLPQRIDTLSGDSVQVTFPDGYEEVLAMKWASLILDKGALESGAAAELDGRAEKMVNEMLQDLGRPSTDSYALGYTDSASVWGGA